MIDRLLLPVRVAPKAMLKLGIVMFAVALEKFTVPPAVNVNAPTVPTVALGLKFAVPPLLVSAPVLVTGPLKFVSDELENVVAPVTL